MNATAKRHAFIPHCRAVVDVERVQIDVMLLSLSSASATRGLSLLPNSTDQLSFVVGLQERGVDENDRRALARLASTRNELADYRVGPLV